MTDERQLKWARVFVVDVDAASWVDDDIHRLVVWKFLEEKQKSNFGMIWQFSMVKWMEKVMKCRKYNWHGLRRIYAWHCLSLNIFQNWFRVDELLLFSTQWPCVARIQNDISSWKAVTSHRNVHVIQWINFHPRWNDGSNLITIDIYDVSVQ